MKPLGRVTRDEGLHDTRRAGRRTLQLERRRTTGYGDGRGDRNLVPEIPAAMGKYRNDRRARQRGEAKRTLGQAFGCAKQLDVQEAAARGGAIELNGHRS